jgi:hypothetical protein
MLLSRGRICAGRAISALCFGRLPDWERFLLVSWYIVSSVILQSGQGQSVSMHLLMGCNVSQSVPPRTLFQP